MNKGKCLLLLLALMFVQVNYCQAQKLTEQEKKSFQTKCKQLARNFCDYIEDLTEENSDTQQMTYNEFYGSEACQWTIGQMRYFFSQEDLKSGQVIGYTTGGKTDKPVQVVYTSIEKYIKMLLKQRVKYKAVRYDYSAFLVSNLIEKMDDDGNIYYEGKVDFSQNYFASKNKKGNSEIGWDVVHEDYKSLTFKIESISSRDGKFYAITFQKLKIDMNKYEN